jgi:hypothetical protein
MAFMKLQFKPGVMKESTQYGSAPYWSDADYVRFRSGYPEVIGGWTKAISLQFVGKPRSGNAWSTLSNLSFIGLGTNAKFYVYDGGSYRDVTPLRKTTSPLANNSITTGAAGSGTITITDTSHGAAVGDYVTISGATAFNGLTLAQLNQEFVILTVPTANTYTVATGGSCTLSTIAGGGASIVAAYQITIGLDSSVFGGGWGAGPYSRGGWGDGYDGSIAGATLRLWSQSNYGEDLIACPRDSTIYFWDSSANGRMTSLQSQSGSIECPTIAKEVLVSQERHVIAFGPNTIFTSVQDPLLVRWSSKESYIDWSPDQENSSGELRIPTGAAFITHQQTQSEILMWTESSLSSMRYVGAPLYYGIQNVGKTTIMGPKAKASWGDTVFWMGTNKFYRYDGRITSMPCTVEDYVFSDLNLNQKWKVCAGSNMSHNEVFWFYPSESSDEVNKYVCYNYVDDIWTIGSLARTVWVDRSVYNYPFAAGTDQYGYYHEFGYSDGSTNPGGAINAFIESSPVELAPAGESYAYIDQIIPDLTFRDSTSVSPAATLTMTPRRFPGSNVGIASASGVTRSVSGTIEQYTELLNIRLRAHAVTFKISSNQAGTGWRLGSPRVRVRADGRK